MVESTRAACKWGCQQNSEARMPRWQNKTCEVEIFQSSFAQSYV